MNLEPQKHTIGILAGMGPRSTAPFLNRVLDECELQYGAKDDSDFPRILVCSQPAPFRPGQPVDHRAMYGAARAGLSTLEESGCGFAAMACNTTHMYYTELSREMGIPLLNMVDLAVAAVARVASAVAIVAARPTVESQIYQRALASAGVDVVPVDFADDIDHLLCLARTKSRTIQTSLAWEKLSDKVREAGASSILIACLDLSGTIDTTQDKLIRIDAAACLASAIISSWLRGDANDN